MSFCHVDVKAALELSAHVDSKYYAIHAGFRLDPSPNNLGQTLSCHNLVDEIEAEHIFIESMNLVNAYASNLGVTLLIENNVISKKNFSRFQGNPLLMCESKSIESIFNRVHSNVGLLLDVAHLKVSCTTLGLEPGFQISSVSDLICGYHLSENDGTSDSNQKISVDDWFWPFIRTDVNYVTLEVYNEPPIVLKNQVDLVNNMTKK